MNLLLPSLLPLLQQILHLQIPIQAALTNLAIFYIFLLMLVFAPDKKKVHHMVTLTLINHYQFSKSTRSNVCMHYNRAADPSGRRAQQNKNKQQT